MQFANPVPVRPKAAKFPNHQLKSESRMSCQKYVQLILKFAHPNKERHIQKQLYCFQPKQVPAFPGRRKTHSYTIKPCGEEAQITYPLTYIQTPT